MPVSLCACLFMFLHLQVVLSLQGVLFGVLHTTKEEGPEPQHLNHPNRPRTLILRLRRQTARSLRSPKPRTLNLKLGVTVYGLGYAGFRVSGSGV